jgi:hypothetical protein
MTGWEAIPNQNEKLKERRGNNLVLPGEHELQEKLSETGLFGMVIKRLEIFRQELGSFTKRLKIVMRRRRSHTKPPEKTRKWGGCEIAQERPDEGGNVGKTRVR